MRNGLLACTFAILGCFNEGDTIVTTGADDDSGSDTGGSTDASGMAATSAGSAEATTVGPDPDTSSDGGSDPTTGSAESSTGATPTWCDEQPGTILVCHDFDGPLPFLGAAPPLEMHGTVDLSDDRSTSPPNSMRVEVMPDAIDPSNASIGQQLLGATLPFDGVVATDFFVEPECFAGAGAAVERLALALQYFDNRDPDGPFLLNTTIWFTADRITYYESDQPQGYGDNTIGHDLPVALDTSEWHSLAIAHDAKGSAVTVTIDGIPHEVLLELATQDVIGQIADVVPTIAVGTTMANNQSGCTMYFDDVIVTE